MFSTSQAALQLGVSRNTLLRWLREGRVSEVSRDRNGWRVFSAESIQRIRAELGEIGATEQLEPQTLKMLNYLRRVPVFSQLKTTDLAMLSRAARFVGYLKGQALYTPGDMCLGALVLVKGKVRITRPTVTGREMTLTVVTPFQTLGESAMFGSNRTYVSRALCIESSTALVVPQRRLQQILGDCPALARAFLTELAHRIQDLEQRLEEQATLSLDQRLAKLLLDSMDSDGRVRLSLSQSDLASSLGVTRESLSRAFGRLARDGMIRRERGDISVIDSQALTSL